MAELVDPYTMEAVGDRHNEAGVNRLIYLSTVANLYFRLILSIIRDSKESCNYIENIEVHSIVWTIRNCNNQME